MVIAARAAGIAAGLLTVLAAAPVALTPSGTRRPGRHLRLVEPTGRWHESESLAGLTLGERVAELATAYRGDWAWRAYVDAGQASPGELSAYVHCRSRAFLDCLVRRASGFTVEPVAGDGAYRGAVRVELGAVRWGDIIQTRRGGHAAVVLDQRAQGEFRVADAHYHHDDLVAVHWWTPPPWSVGWRYSQPATG